jgi:hypothetical protein
MIFLPNSLFTFSKQSNSQWQQNDKIAYGKLTRWGIIRPSISSGIAIVSFAEASLLSSFRSASQFHFVGVGVSAEKFTSCLFSISIHLIYKNKTNIYSLYIYYRIALIHKINIFSAIALLTSFDLFTINDSLLAVHSCLCS